MDREADAATHGDTVYKRDVWNPTRTRQVVELQMESKILYVSFHFWFHFADQNVYNYVPDIPL